MRSEHNGMHYFLREARNQASTLRDDLDTTAPCTILKESGKQDFIPHLHIRAPLHLQHLISIIMNTSITIPK